MGSAKNRRVMMILKGGANCPTAAPTPDHSTGCLMALRPGKVHNSGTVQGTCVPSGEAKIIGKHRMYPAKDAILKMSELKHPSSLSSSPNVLSPDCVCKDVKVTLENNGMWNEFFKCRTEMILTKQGSRMFPYCRFRISGLQSSKKYSLLMDVEPLDNSQYKWTGESWQVCRKAECHVRTKPFLHPDSPTTGQHWMQSPVSFYRMKLTNNISDQEGNIILHQMHRYLPQLHLVQSDQAVEDFRLNGPNVLTFTFPQTEFITVLTYQNPQFTQLKVNYNPFVKKLKDDRLNFSGLKPKGNVDIELSSYEGKTNTETHPVKKSLKILLANHKPRNSKAPDLKGPAPKDSQERSTTYNTRSAATVPEESPSNSSHPAPKLISELICEAHVSLQRCGMEQQGSNKSNPNGAAQSNTTSSALTVKNKQSVVHNNGSVTTSSRKSPIVEPSRKIKDNEPPFNSPNYIPDVRTVCSAACPIGEQVSLNKSHQKFNADPASDGVKGQKRPARLPLPALALFLKQHSLKSKKLKNTQESASQLSPRENSSSPSSATAPQQEASVEPIMEDPGKSNVLPDKNCLNVAQDSIDTNLQLSSQSTQDPEPVSETAGPKNENSFISISESLGSGTICPEPKALKSNSANTFDSLEDSTLSLSTCSTSGSSDLSLIHNTALSLPDSPKSVAESSTLPSGSRSVKIDCMLPDPQCSSFDFDPLSPASSPEPLPSLPASLALEFDSATSAPTSAAESFDDSQQSKNSSVFKWHTVLPLSGTYTNSSFHPEEQSAPIMSVTPPLLSCLPEPQSVNTSTPSPTKDTIPAFQENEQSLSFPAELSPLALQLPLSPTFCSLDEDGLSPTTSLSELVQFFSTNDDIGVEFSNPDTAAVPTQPSPVSEQAQLLVPVQPVSASNTCKRKKTSRMTRLARLEAGHSGSDYTSKQPKVEEVEEQLFVSFTSKEALRLHTAESSGDPLPDSERMSDTEAAEQPENSSIAKGQGENIHVYEDTLLRDLKLMKHRQVIHPVLQEVGLKMNLLDPALSIDLQYLGVSLPIPPPGVDLELLTPSVPKSQGVFGSFQSRTGKATDVTQIKGWKEKFTPSEAEPASALKPEAAPSADPPKKNLSAFCSDMLDEYLESEGKLIDERASSFSQPPTEPPSYQLPVSSTSYVRTLDHIVKKPTPASPASDIISGFIPPSKRSRLKRTSMCRRPERKQKGSRENKPKPGSAQTQGALPGSVLCALSPTSEFLDAPTFKRRRRIKPRASSQTLSALKVSEDMAPLESDSELRPDSGPKLQSNRPADAQKKEIRAPVTRPFARLKELEDSVVLEGRFKTSITKERAAAALMSLFTQTGFVRDNPVAPIGLRQPQALPCLNEFCRLGCVCSSLSHSSRISHCGRPSCMFGCSCLKQKVVLLKILDSSDSGPTSLPCETKQKKRKRGRMIMKMAYVLKEADTVAQPADRVRTLWRKNAVTSDPEPVNGPNLAPFLRPAVRRKYRNSCARVRGFIWKMQKPEESKAPKSHRNKDAGLQFLKHGEQTTEQTLNTPRAHSSADSDPPCNFSSPSPSESTYLKPSKRLLILADCQWERDGDRSHVLKKLCEAMALDQLDRPFWIRKYLITPIEQNVDESNGNKCIQYKVQITTPIVETAASTGKAVTHRRKQRIKPAALHRRIRRKHKNSELIPKNKKPSKGFKKPTPSMESVENWQKEVMEEEEPMEDWQYEVREEEESMEDWQKEVMEEEKPMEDWQKEVMEEEESTEDWQKEVMEEEETIPDLQKKLKVEPLEDCQKEEDPIKDWEKEESVIGREKRLKVEPLEDCQKETKEQYTQKDREACKINQGSSSAGFLSANKKQPGGSEDMIQVNGKQYPFAKIQLGRMGALHPANRLAAYLTGRVKSQQQQQASSSSEPSWKSQSPHCAASSSCVPAAPAASTFPSVMLQSQPPVLSVSSSADSEPQDMAVGSSSASLNLTPPTDSQPLLIQVPNPPKVVNVLPSPVRQVKGQRMVLKPAQSSSGMRCYKTPDGRLVQLISTNQLRPIVPSATIQRDSEPQDMAVGSSSASLNLTPPTDSQPLLIEVPNPPKVVKVLPPPVRQVKGQRMVLKPAQSSSGMRCYKTPDGRLVQLISTNQLRPIVPSATIQRDSASVPPPPPAAVVKTPTLTNSPSSAYPVVHSAAVLPSPPTGCPPSSSGPINQLLPPSTSASQQSSCAFKIVSPGRVKEPILIKLPYLPPSQGTQGILVRLEGPSHPVAPVNCPRLNPFPLEVKPEVETECLPVEFQTQPASQTPAETTIPRVPSPTAQLHPPIPFSGGLSHEEDVALGPADLDIVCVDTTELVDLVSGSETDTADFIETDSEDNMQSAAAAGELTADCQQRTSQQKVKKEEVEDEKNALITMENCGSRVAQLDMTSSSDTDSEVEATSSALDSSNTQRKRGANQRDKHNISMRRQRAQMNQMFVGLKDLVLPNDAKTSRVFTLEKAAELIQELRRSEKRLKRKKKSLEETRDAYLSILVPSTVELTRTQQLGNWEQEEQVKTWDSPLEKLEEDSGGGAAQQEMTSASDMDTEVEAPSSAEDSSNTPQTRQLGQAPQAVQRLPTETKRLSRIQSMTKNNNQDAHMEEICGTSETEKRHNLLSSQTNQNQADTQERKQTANNMPVEGLLCVTLPAGEAQTSPAASCLGLALPTAVQLQPYVSECPSSLPVAFSNASGTSRLIKTVPNILCRSRGRAPPLKTSATEDPTLAKVVFAAPSGGPPFLLLSAGVSPHQDPARPLRPAAPQSSVPNMEPHSAAQRSEPTEQEAPRESHNEGLSSLLNEIVFLNQQTVATPTNAGEPSAVMDSSTSGGTREQRQSSDHPGLTAGHTSEGVLTPPPLLQMKVGGAKGSGVGTNNGAAVGGTGSGGVAWRPMPRLVPLGLRGNSPS